jgi:glycosyltransferase involved in cell wall biosynthesis
LDPEKEAQNLPMRILHVSHQQLKYLGARNYFFPVRINNGFIRNQHEVYWFSDRDVARCSNIFGTRKMGVKACNRKLLEVCRNFQPDVIALSSADIIHPDTLVQARKVLPNVAIFQYYIDALFYESNLRNARSKAEVVDWTFVTTAGPILKQLAGARSRVAFIPNPVDPSIDVHHCHERSDQPYDVFFAGHMDKRMDTHDLRGLAYDLIRERMPDIHCAFYGHGQSKSLFGAEFLRALGNAKIGLNFSLRVPGAVSGPGGNIYMYSSDRVGLYLGNGLLVFSTQAFSLSELYGDEALVEVEGPDDFIDKLRFYVENDGERRRIARNGYELGHREFNERLVSEYMLETALDLPFSHPYRWPAESYNR